MFQQVLENKTKITRMIVNNLRYNFYYHIFSKPLDFTFTFSLEHSRHKLKVCCSNKKHNEKLVDLSLDSIGHFNFLNTKNFCTLVFHCTQWKCQFYINGTVNFQEILLVWSLN